MSELAEGRSEVVYRMPAETRVGILVLVDRLVTSS